MRLLKSTHAWLTARHCGKCPICRSTIIRGDTVLYLRDRHVTLDLCCGERHTQETRRLPLRGTAA